MILFCTVTDEARFELLIKETEFSLWDEGSESGLSQVEVGFSLWVEDIEFGLSHDEARFSLFDREASLVLPKI